MTRKFRKGRKARVVRTITNYWGNEIEKGSIVTITGVTQNWGKDLVHVRDGVCDVRDVEESDLELIDARHAVTR